MRPPCLGSEFSVLQGYPVASKHVQSNPGHSKQNIQLITRGLNMSLFPSECLGEETSFRSLALR